MKNISVGVFAVLMIALLACSCAPVTIRSAPDQAGVYTPGGKSPLGVTPYDTSIVQKEKQFVLRKDGYWETAVTVEADSPRFMDVRMARMQSTVIESQPQGATVYDASGSQLLGKTPFTCNLIESDQNYTLKLDGFYDNGISVTLESPFSMVVPLIPMPKKVTLRSVPSGADVYLAGDFNPMGKTPMTTVVEEQAVYEIKADKYYPATVTLTAQSNPETSVSLKPMPYITINSSPAGADLYPEGSQGKSLGATPITRLIENAASFELRKEGYAPEPFKLSPEAPSTVTIQLKELPYVTIKSSPAGAKLYRKGGVEFLGETPIKQLIRQPMEFELRLKGYPPRSFELSGEVKDVTVDMEGNETLLMQRAN